MKLSKIVTLSLIFLVSLSALLCLLDIKHENGSLYQTLLTSLSRGTKSDVDLTQIKENVDRTYWFLSKPEPFYINITYPVSQVYRDSNIIEEITDLSAKAVAASSTNILTAERGRLDYGQSLLSAENAHLQRFKEENQFCEAFAEEITLNLKESSPTFVANNVKAEIQP